MFLRNCRYALRDSIRSISRHKLMSLLTILTITITLAVLSLSCLVALNSYNASRNVENQLRVVVFLNDSASDEQTNNLKNKITKTEHVENVKFVSKNEALNSLNTQFQKSEMDLKTSLEGENPLPNSFQITVDDAKNIEGIVTALKNEPIVDNIKYGEDIVQSIINLNQTAMTIGIIIIALMLIATLFLINTTIQLAVTNRSEEIQIMKLVGAKNSFVRFPFFLEGIIIGLIGAAFSGILVYLGYHQLYYYIYATIPFLPILYNSTLMISIILANIIIGVVLGALGSIFAVHKHLKI